MLFNSVAFLIFFPVVTLLYFLLPHKLRWSWLLAASCFFYMFFKPEYILILGFTIVVDYFAGILIAQQSDPKRRKQYLLISLVANIGVLAVFKYYNFLNDNLTGLATLFGFKNPVPYLTMLLPIGLSFHTFQAMSYTLEVYRGNQEPEKHFGIYALYVMFYPQLVAGPIERPQNVLHQFHQRHHFRLDNLYAGLQQIVWGLFKKVVIADRIAIIVDHVYAQPSLHNGFSLLLTILLYSFQIYCDFSGYSDIALGTAKVMGFDLMKNFNFPFRSKTVTEFWRRWHISLYTWFSDYLYTPLAIAQRDRGKWGVVFAILVTFSVSGLWHGASWTFVVYGLLHGMALSYESLNKKYRKRAAKNTPAWLYAPFSLLTTFFFCSAAWVYFRSGTFAQANYILGHVFTRQPGHNYFEVPGHQVWGEPVKYLGVPASELFGTLALIPLLLLLEQLLSNRKNEAVLQRLPAAVRWPIYYSVLFLLIFLGVYSKNNFIYFQF